MFPFADYRTAQDTRINLRWNDGVDATDWQSVAKKENLDSVHTELLRLEHAVHVMHLELQHIRRKEEEMRNVNGACPILCLIYSLRPDLFLDT